MSKNLEKYLIVKKECKRIYNKEIIDILLFGSLARGKSDAKDIDICIIFRNKRDLDLINNLSTIFENKNINVHISSLIIDEFFRRPHSLIRTLLGEGISILTNKKLSGNFGLESYVLYTYNLTMLNGVNKVKFTYILRGRKNKGIVEKNKGYFLAPSCFIIPINVDAEIKQIFDLWNIKYARKAISLTK